MPEYVALRCYSCGTFQSHQMRKDSKFKCTICGASQSYRKVYCRSFKPNDVRSIVQDYNMRRGEIDQQEAAEARKAMERKQAMVEEGDGESSNPLVEDNPWGDYEAEEARNRKKEELAQAGDDDTITTALPIAASARRGRGRGRGQPKGWEVVSGSKANPKQGKRTREEEYDSEFTQSNSGSRLKKKKQSTNTNSSNSIAFRDRNETGAFPKSGASAQSFSQTRPPSNNSFEKLKGLNSSANDSQVSLPPSVLLPASPGDLERQKRLERAEMMKRQFQERLQAKQQQADSSGLAISLNNSSRLAPQLPKPTNNNSFATGSSVPNFRPPISNNAINRRPVSLSAQLQAQPKSEWDEYLDEDEQRDRSDSEDDLVFEQEQNSTWETL